jgi:uncharacterized protein (TIGR02453 family)
MKNEPRFSPKSIDFLKKAGRQKRKDWLEKHEVEFKKWIQDPLQNLARHLKAELGPLAPDYHFPQKGIGRMKRSAQSVATRGGGLYKDWLAYSASRPRTSRFEHNPNLFFLINTEDPKDTVLVAGGLYMPSSRQTRTLRETLAQDASAFEELFASKAFARCFPDGFSDERISSRPTRGYDPEHPRMHWLRLQAFFVWHPYSRREFSSAEFPQLVARDLKQVLRLNRLLEQALDGRLRLGDPKQKSPGHLLERLEGLDRFEHKSDF